MSLIVNNVISSSVKIEYSYLDTDELFGYKVIASYQINVSDIQFEADGGILLAGRSAIRTAYGAQNITARIAGDDFVNGLITSLSFGESNLVGSEVASITIEEMRRLNDYSSHTFAKYIPSPHLLESFDENYTFSRQDSTYSYSRNITIKYSQDAGIDFLDNAKIFLSNYYRHNRPSYGYYEDGISEDARFDAGFNGTLSEKVDLVNLEVSLKEDFDSSLIETGKDYSKKITQKYSQGNDGFLGKTINIEITALKYNAQNIMESAMAEVIDDIVSAEAATFGKPNSITKGITKDSKKGTVSLSFSTNPNLSQDSVITYSCDKTKQGAFEDYNLKTKYKAVGKSVYDRYYKTIDLWKSEKGNNETKVASLFRESEGAVYEKGRSCSISRSNGTVTESITFSTDDSYDGSALPAGIIKYNITSTKTNKIKRNEKILDLYSLREKLVVSDLDTLGQATVTAIAIAEPSRGIVFAKNFLNRKTSEMEAALNEDTYYLTSDQTTIDLSTGTTTRVISFVIA